MSRKKKTKLEMPDYTTSGLIRALNYMAEVGIVNAKEDTETLRMAADRLFSLRESLDPLWNRWLIMDDGLFLEEISLDGESLWTDIKDDAMWFEDKESAEKYIDENTREIVGSSAVLRGDCNSFPLNIIFCGLS